VNDRQQYYPSELVGAERRQTYYSSSKKNHQIKI
jgi:hypothetical protein